MNDGSYILVKFVFEEWSCGWFLLLKHIEQNVFNFFFLKNGSRILEFFGFAFPHHIISLSSFLPFAMFQKLTTYKREKIALAGLNYLSNHFMPGFLFWCLQFTLSAPSKNIHQRSRRSGDNFHVCNICLRYKCPGAGDWRSYTVYPHNTGPAVPIMRLTRWESQL